jgi:hypothetical protein
VLWEDKGIVVGRVLKLRVEVVRYSLPGHLFLAGLISSKSRVYKYQNNKGNIIDQMSVIAEISNSK